MRRWRFFCAVGALLTCGAAIVAQRSDAFTESRDHPAIAYSTAPVSNAITVLNEQLASGRLTLAFDEASGYLRAVLNALSIPIESQALVFSQTSFQARKINRSNPRAIYFNDHVAVGFVRGGDILEVAVQDERQGTIFYTLPQTRAEAPRFTRDDKCLSCHLSWDTRGVPGPFLMTVFPRRSEDEYANGFVVDHRAPLLERWGGWFVTGTRVPESMANTELLQPRMPASGPRRVPSRPSLDGLFDPAGYPSMFSDVVALMVLEHQAHATNLITRAGWEHRIASPHARAAVEELVDYLLFVDEVRLPHPVKGSSGFADAFARVGPRDRRGRSLRELDLTTRLMRYPLSYMIYSPGFVGLPDDVKRTVRHRIDDILAGRDANRKYAHLSAEMRVAMREILADTWERE
jgi:hypothetical protein